jgi:hypothetical protein
VIDVAPAVGKEFSPREIASGPFERLRVGKVGGKTRLVLDLRGVVTPSQIRFIENGGNLVVEVPTDALARR